MGTRRETLLGWRGRFLDHGLNCGRIHFAPWEEQDSWTFLPFFFMAQDRVQSLERICRVPFSAWIRQKFIEATSGNAIDLRAVLDRIRWGREMFDLREVPYGRLNFRTEALNLIDDGITATEVQQSFLHLSYPTKFLLSAYGDRKIRHGNNPVLNWMASCLQLQYDHKDNCQPSKPERMRSSKRTDGIQAIVTALARALVAGNTTSVYETKGITIL
jgi:phage terminase large subunit-like protein